MIPNIPTHIPTLEDIQAIFASFTIYNTLQFIQHSISVGGGLVCL